MDRSLDTLSAAPSPPRTLIRPRFLGEGASFAVSPLEILRIMSLMSSTVTSLTRFLPRIGTTWFLRRDKVYARVRGFIGRHERLLPRSEERRGGQESVCTCRARWLLEKQKKKK